MEPGSSYSAQYGLALCPGQQLCSGPDGQIGLFRGELPAAHPALATAYLQAGI